MLITIGQRPDHGFDERLGLLSDCHRRIEHFLRVLVAIAEQANGGPLMAVHRSQLDGALAYFATAAPRHTADEEESLFPRLRASREAAARDTLDLLGRLEHDHADVDEHHGTVDRLVRQWLTNGWLTASDVPHFVNTSPRFRPSTSDTLRSKIASSSPRPAGCSLPGSFATSARRWPRDDPSTRAHRHMSDDPSEIFCLLFARAALVR